MIGNLENHLRYLKYLRHYLFCLLGIKHPHVSAHFGAGMGVINDIVLLPFIPAKIIAKLPDIYDLCLCQKANPAYEDLIVFCNYNI